jgi:GT2 family glycosyltransferase
VALWFVSATRETREAFDRKAPLARSLARVSGSSPFVLAVAYANTLPLPDVYNRAIDAAGADDTLLFVHDDVWIDDWRIASRLDEALAAYDVAGVAGNRRRVPRQEGWILAGDTREQDVGHLSGAIAHGAPGAGEVHAYGPAPADAKLLDGVFLAARARVLKAAGVRFDAQFPFHFYDTDFCRACERAGLRMGTWPIALTHASMGSGWTSPGWEAAYRAYLAKWGD